MRRLSLPKPPDPDHPAFKSNPHAYSRAMYDWARQVKQLTEQAHNITASPCGQQIQVSSFTTNTALSGTATGTDLTNFVCSLVATLQDKGILSPTITIGNTQ